MKHENDIDTVVICPLCGDPITPWDERAEWKKGLAHAFCVDAQGEPLDREELENYGFYED